MGSEREREGKVQTGLALVTVLTASSLLGEKAPWS